ncbi:hypothetical protein CspHIS471_0702630 [Cutaneotrichosporon sp. HIS471]|nr:hypothetical protein CspHIS471_0702630 [Cutaneotrichosporon sp. HIS471]
MTPAAKTLRPGIPFTIDVPNCDNLREFVYILGMLNIHFPITFQDGVKWLGRVHSTGGRLGNGQDKVRAGEVAVIKTLREIAPEFVPNIHIPPGQTVHKLKFFFNERSEGQRYELWPAMAAETGFQQVVKDIAQFMVKISTKEFSGVGSLKFDMEQNIVVGPLVAKHFKRTELANLEVYRTSAECYLARIDNLLRLIREKTLGWASSWSKDDMSTPVWRYIILLEVRDFVNGCEDMNREQPTYIRHKDDHVGQFLVNDSGRLDDIIDWEFSAVVPFAEAFTAPDALSINLPRPGMRIQFTDANVLTFLELQLQEELRALGREDMALAVGDTRKFQRLDWAMFGSNFTYEFAVGLRRALYPDAKVPSSKEEWIEEGMVKYGHDEQLKELPAGWEVYKQARLEAETAKAEAEAKKNEAEAAKTEVEPLSKASEEASNPAKDEGDSTVPESLSPSSGTTSSPTDLSASDSLAIETPSTEENKSSPEAHVAKGEELQTSLDQLALGAHDADD